MSIRLQRLGDRIGPNRISACLSPPQSVPDPLFDPATWILERDEGLLGFVPAAQNERLLTITASLIDDVVESLCFGLTALSGTYRLRTTHAAVDPDYAVVVFRLDAKDQDPFYLEIEGLHLNGMNVIPAAYIDQSRLPASLSQTLDMATGVAVSGGMDIRLVDLDGDLTAAFNPRHAEETRTSLTVAIDKDDAVIVLENADGFPESGVAYIGQEAVVYETKAGAALLTGITRGAHRTRANEHLAGEAVMAANPYWRGRFAWLRRPTGSTRRPDDPVLFAGIIDSLSPAADNLAGFSLSLTDPLGNLDNRVGTQMGSGRLIDQVMIQAEKTQAGRRGNDTLYLRRSVHPSLGWETITARLAPGPYLADARSLGHPRNLATALKLAIDRVVPGVAGDFDIDADGRLHLRFRVDYMLQLVDQAPVSSDHDSILGTLGFEGETGEIYQNPAGATSSPGLELSWVEVAAKHVLAGGVGSYNTRIYLASPSSLEPDLRYFESGQLVSIDDELVAYTSIQGLDDTAPETVLAFAVGVDSTVLRLAIPDGFPESGGWIQIEEEVIVYGSRPANSNLLLDCYRGAWGSEAAVHAPGATVSMIEWPCLVDCLRGLYGTRPVSHAAGSTVQEWWCSDRIINPGNGEPLIIPSTPEEFLLDLLDADRPLSRHGLRLPPGLVDTASFADTLAGLSVNYDHSFRRMILPDEIYRDVAADICRSLGVYLVSDSTGRLKLGRFRPRLAHETSDAEVDHTVLLDPPHLTWREDLRIDRVEATLDYSPVDERFDTCVIVSDETGLPIGSAHDHTLTLESRALRSGRLTADAAGESWLYNMAWGFLRRYNRFLTQTDLILLPSVAEGLELLSRIELSSPLVCGGAGDRGIEKCMYDVVEIERDLEGERVRLGALERGQGRYGGFAPAAEIIGWETASRTLTLTADRYWPSDLHPEQVYAANEQLRIKYAPSLAAGSWVVSEQLVIVPGGVDVAAWETTGCFTLSLDVLPTLLPQPGDILIPAAYGDHDPALSRLAAFVYLADTNARLDTTEPAYEFAF